MSLLAELHWLRPWWLLAGGLALLAVGWRWWQQRRNNPWRRVCDAALLPYLLAQAAPLRQHNGPFILLATGLLLGTLALAGPAWQRLPVPLWEAPLNRVVVLDLSRSMLALDIAPDRITRARFKVADMLERSRNYRTALIAFSGEAFTITPLTRDVNTLIHLLWSLSPKIMPLGGSAAQQGLQRAATLLASAGALAGEVILVTDGVRGSATAAAAARLQQQGVRVSVLAVGTKGGGPIPLANGGFLVDDAGHAVIPGVALQALRNVAARGGGRFAQITTDNADIDYLVGADEQWSSSGGGTPDAKQSTFRTPRYRDDGWRFMWLLVPLAVFAFRRDWLLLWPLALLPALLLPAPPLSAGEFDDPWRRADQRSAHALQRGAYASAAQHAPDYRWRGAALYRARNYRASARAFAEGDDAEAHYNRANALAQSGQLQAALRAYDKALEQAPEHADASANRDLTAKLLHQQAAAAAQSPNDHAGDSDDEAGSKRHGKRAAPDRQADGPQDNAEPDNANSTADAGAVGQPPPAATSPKTGNAAPAAGNPEVTTAGNGTDADADPEGAATAVPPALAGEQQQRLEQWLRRIPDAPDGLLKRKLALDYQRRGRPPPVTDEAW